LGLQIDRDESALHKQDVVLDEGEISLGRFDTISELLSCSTSSIELYWIIKCKELFLK
jgi:hypothetical protein